MSATWTRRWFRSPWDWRHCSSWGGPKRGDRPRRIPLLHGDVVVWGGPSAADFHGVHALPAGVHPLTGALRYNLTFRKAL